VCIEGEGWDARISNELVCVEAGKSADLPVWVSKIPGKKGDTSITVTATSESDPGVSSTVTIELK